jgi:acetylglutamate kinase
MMQEVRQINGYENVNLDVDQTAFPLSKSLMPRSLMIVSKSSLIVRACHP